jgi:5-methylcytosine-specific restriction endonuclease McrA
VDKKEYLKLWREANKEKIREDNKLYQQENKEKIAENKRAYYRANREKFIERAKAQYAADQQKVIDRAAAWNKEHPEKHRESESKWAKANPDKKNAATKRYREAHPELCKKRLRDWRKSNPALVRHYTQQRRARTSDSEGTITIEQVESLYNKLGGKCGACRKKLNGTYHLDHVMPLSLGGKHVIDNADILCPKCNQRKHATHPDTWAAMHGKLFV